MLKALRFFAWPLVVGLLLAMLIIQRYPEWVGMPSHEVNLQQAPISILPQRQGPVSYASAVVAAAPAVTWLLVSR